MAIYIPIVSEFKSTGIDKAKKEFASLDGVAAKAQFAIKKAAVPAAAAMAGLAAALGDATKGAMEDAAAQDKLAGQLKRSTKATDAQIAANEDWIASQGQLRAIADDELRPAIAKLATVTKDVTKAQEAAIIAMDVAAATGKPLESVTTAIAKAMGGQTTALAKLDPSLRDLVKSGADADTVMKALNKQFGGAAVDAANTTEGGFKKLKIAMDETKESVGAALLPVIEKALPVLQSFAAWAQNNPNAFLAIAAAIGAVAVAITAVNIAMALNPFTLIAAGIALLVTGVVVAYKKFEGFRNAINTILNSIINGINLVIRALNLVKPGKDIPSIPNISSAEKQASAGDFRMAEGWSVPKMATGGIVTAPTLALIGEAGPEAVVPLDRAGGMGTTNVTINVNGGDPNAVVAALRSYMRTNGAVPIRVATAI